MRGRHEQIDVRDEAAGGHAPLLQGVGGALEHDHGEAGGAQWGQLEQLGLHQLAPIGRDPRGREEVAAHHGGEPRGIELRRGEPRMQAAGARTPQQAVPAELVELDRRMQGAQQQGGFGERLGAHGRLANRDSTQAIASSTSP